MRLGRIASPDGVAFVVIEGDPNSDAICKEIAEQYLSRNPTFTGRSWPLADVPGIARRARTYIRAKWKPDAELTEIDVKLLKSNEAGIFNINSTDGGLELKFSFYSPSTQEGLWFQPFSQAGSMFPMGVINRNGRGSLPDNFLDLPKAVEMLKAHGMRAKKIYSAELEDWGRGSSAGGLRLDGVMWMIDTQLDERFSVRATQ